MRRDAKIKEVDGSWKLRESSSFVKKRRREAESFKSFEYINFGFYIVVPLLLGVFVGLELDKYFKAKPFFILLGIVFGTVSMIYNLWSLLKDIKRKF